MKETGKARVSPVCDFVNRVGNDTDKVPKRPCWANVSRLWTSRVNPTNPRKTIPSPSPVGGGVKETDRARQRRKELARRPAQNLSSDRSITPKNRAVERGVKKEQVKGCGSVNRPTPGSQCPAEPATSGFLQGVKISKIRGQISGLGVKLWVVGAGFSRPRAILHGVKVWVVAVSCFQQGKQSARLSAEHNWRG